MIASPSTQRAAAAPASTSKRPPSLLAARPAGGGQTAKPRRQASGGRPLPTPPRAAAPSFLDGLAKLFAPASSSSSSRSSALRQTPTAIAAAKRIVELAESTERGTKTTPEAKKEILSLALALRDDEAPLASGSAAAAKQLLSGTWRQLYSTEKETLFIFTTIAPLFGVKGEEAYQVIDAEAGRLQNVITFSNGAAFVVESTLSVEEEEQDEDQDEGEETGGPLPLRCTFRFTGATLKLPSGKAFKLPPAGKGWFDTTYVDSGARVAFDVRGDTLVVERDGPPRWF
jgi:hypothetical protein